MENPKQNDVVVGPDPDRTNKAPKSYGTEVGSAPGKKRDDPPTGGSDQGSKGTQSYPTEGK